MEMHSLVAKKDSKAIAAPIGNHKRRYHLVIQLMVEQLLRLMKIYH